MYWRIKKYSPDIIARQYGIHAVCIVSVIFNLFLFTRLNASKAAVPATEKLNYERFCRQVTSHLFDANYCTFEESVGELMKRELAPSVQTQQKKIEFLPKTLEEMKAISREMAEKKSVSCVKVVQCEVGQPDGKGLLPVNMVIQVVRMTVEGHDVNYFRLQYLVGKNKQTHDPIVAALGISQVDASQVQPLQQVQAQ